MSVVVLLGSGPLGLVSQPQATPASRACVEWLRSLLLSGTTAMVPEIADYEVRRELFRADRRRSVRQLDRLKETIGYLPLTTEAMLQAAEFWTEARRRGRPTADPHALDRDVILAAQAAVLGRGGNHCIVASSNHVHLAQFVDARPWHEVA